MDITNVSFIDDLIYKHLHQSYLNDGIKQLQCVSFIINNYETCEQTKRIITFIKNLISLGIPIEPPSLKFDNGEQWVFSMPHIPQQDDIENESCEWWDMKQYNLMKKHSKYIQHMFDKLEIGHYYDDCMDVHMF
jgi:hypothetical protein